MSLFLFFLLSKSDPQYNLITKTLRITGDGVITQAGVRIPGDYTAYEEVIIEEGPNKISEDSFLECKGLKSISIPASVTEILPCFRSCISLSKIVIAGGNPNYYAENSVMYKRSPLTLFRAPCVKKFTVKEGVTVIESQAFAVNTQYKYGDVVLPSTVTKLNPNSFTESAFDSLSFAAGSQLTTFGKFNWAIAGTLTIPKSVTTIEESGLNHAFIDYLVFEDGMNLDTIQPLTFSYLTIDSEIVLPNSVRIIGENAFTASTLPSISIGENCESIHETAFSGCTNLKKITVSKSNKFYKSTTEGNLMNKGETEIIFLGDGLTKLTIPETVIKIGSSLLQNSKLLTEIELGGTTTYDTKGGVLYTAGFGELIAVCGGVTSVTIDKRAIKVNPFAASGCNNLVLLTVENDSALKYIGENAFYSTSITSFVLPSSVTEIAPGAFKKCISLTTFTIKEDSLLNTVQFSILEESHIGEIFIPQFLKFINNLFAQNCKLLTKVTFHENSQCTTISNSAFFATAIKTISLPKSLTTLTYEVFAYCYELESVIFHPECTLSEIGKRVFYECKNLLEITLPSTCTTIKNSAFFNCSSLTKVEHSTTTIEGSAFKNCISLTSFNFSANQENLNPSSFQGCYNLVKFSFVEENPNYKEAFGIIFNKLGEELILFPPGKESAYISAAITKFAANAFAWSTKLSYVAFEPDSKLSSIGDSTFFECTALQHFQFPYKLKSINKNCFNGCTALRKITLPESLTVINENAFTNCASLDCVKYCGINKFMGENVFDDGVNIYVTQFYNITTFCGVNVKKELSVDCELVAKCKTCNDRSIIPKFKMLSLLFLIL